MATYRQVQTSFWQDPFVLGLTPEEKYFYIYLMTNSKTTQCGIYELPKRLMELETGYNRDTVDKLLTRFAEYKKIIYSDDTHELMIMNWLKHNKLNSPKVKQCIAKELQTVKNKAFVIKFHELCRVYKYSIDTVSIEWGEEEEKEEEQEEEKEEEKEETTAGDSDHPAVQSPFETFWTIYPRKAAKKDAESAFKALMKLKIPLEDIMLATTNYSQQCQGKELEYIKLPATFLRKERWRDYLQIDSSSSQRFGNAGGGKGNRGSSGKPHISIVSVPNDKPPISPEELEKLRKLARKLDGKKEPTT